jgi:hypothetical protein
MLRRTPLKRGKPLQARKRIKRVSAKRAAETESYRDAVMAMHARSGWRCAAETLVPDVACGGRLDPHHTKLRGVHFADADSLDQVCRSHHDWIHANTRSARALGLLV